MACAGRSVQFVELIYFVTIHHGTVQQLRRYSSRFGIRDPHVLSIMAQKEESLELNLLFPFRAIFAATGFRLYGIYGTLSRDLL